MAAAVYVLGNAGYLGISQMDFVESTKSVA